MTKAVLSIDFPLLVLGTSLDPFLSTEILREYLQRLTK
jgi:hypothetical protein